MTSGLKGSCSKARPTRSARAPATAAMGPTPHPPGRGNHLPHHRRGKGVLRPGGQGREKSGVPGDVGLQLPAFLEHHLPDLSGKVPGGQDPEVGLLDDHPESHQARRAMRLR